MFKFIVILLITLLVNCNPPTSDNSIDYSITIENNSSYDLGIVDFAAYTLEGCQTWRGANGGNIDKGKSGKVHLSSNSDIRRADSWCIKGYSRNYRNDGKSWYSIDKLYLDDGKVQPRKLILTDSGWK